MPSKKITKRTVEAISLAEKDVVLWDTELKGFGCKITPRGRRVYFAYYRTVSGQQRRPVIGEHGTLTAQEARDIAQDWLTAAKKGKDPSTERKLARQAETVSELADRYLEDYAEHNKKPSSVATDRSNIANYVKPLLGRLKVRDVTRADIERAKLSIRKGKTSKSATERETKPRGRRNLKGGPGVANRCVALLSKMFERAEAWGLREGNPARRIEKYAEKPRRRFLDAEELKRLLNALSTAETINAVSPAALAAIRILLFTGARRGEITGLRWREIDFAHNCIRFEDTKTGEDVLPLGSQALLVLSSLSQRKPDDLVIESYREGKQIALTRPWYTIRKAAKLGQDVTLHSLRHTFASWSVMGGFSLAQTGAVLRHKSAQTTLGYAHHEMESRRQTTEAVSNAIAATVNSKPENVVPLRQGAGNE